MKTKFHAGSEPIKKLQHIRTLFDSYFCPNTSNSLPLLAGGCLRDDYMGLHHEISDYDIFIRDMSETTNVDGSFLDIVDGLIDRAFPGADFELLFDNEYQTLEEQHADKSDVKPGSHSQISYVWEVDEGEQTYQLIFTKNDPIVHINKFFDFGLCKTYCDGKKIRYTDDFLYDVKNKTMTIVGDDLTAEQVEYAIYHHAERLSWKYGNFRVVVPPRYQQFVKDKGFPTL